MAKRLTSVLLILSIILFVASSCKKADEGTDVGELISTAEQTLDTQDHTVNISISFISNDGDMKEALESFDSTKITLRKSGDKINLELNVLFEELFVNTSYTVVSDTLYSKVESNLTGEVKGLYQRAMLTDAERGSIVDSAGAGEVLSWDDFNNVTLEENDAVHIITCRDIKDASVQSLVDTFKTAYAAEIDSVVVSDTELIIRLLDGKYNGMYVSCTYAVTIDGVTYEVRMQLSREYDYTTPISITAPLNSEQYTLVPYDTIVK